MKVKLDRFFVSVFEKKLCVCVNNIKVFSIVFFIKFVKLSMGCIVVQMPEKSVSRVEKKKNLLFLLFLADKIFLVCEVETLI